MESEATSGSGEFDYLLNEGAVGLLSSDTLPRLLPALIFLLRQSLDFFAHCYINPSR